MGLDSKASGMEDLLSACSRSIVSPDMIVAETVRIMTIMSDRRLERKYIVEGYETLSVLAAGFMRSGYVSFPEQYSRKEGIVYLRDGFSNKEELIRYCEFCVAYGDECLDKIRHALTVQLELENKMTKDEICNLNRKTSCSDETDRESNTVQDQIIDYIKISILVNSLKEFFREYYKGYH